MKPATHLIHSIPVDELTGAISVPIYQTSTFVQESPGIHKGFEFSRANNPTRKVLEQLICELEEGHAGFGFASGMAAIDAVLKLLKTGDVQQHPDGGFCVRKEESCDDDEVPAF